MLHPIKKVFTHSQEVSNLGLKDKLVIKVKNNLFDTSRVLCFSPSSFIIAALNGVATVELYVVISVTHLHTVGIINRETRL